MIREKVEWITFDCYGTLIEGEIDMLRRESGQWKVFNIHWSWNRE